jgi:8-oxo-dGTP pyrophosphatase MutT (NUDIX family)
MELPRIRNLLRDHRPTEITDEPVARAAVAVVLQQGSAGVEFLAIRRSERPGDPWSGHMALPGGRMDPGDISLTATAARETFEEVGIDLDIGSVHVGRLDDLRAVSLGRAVDLIISPFVFALDSPREPIPNPREVQEAFWIPLRTLIDQDRQGGRTHHENGYPAFVHEGNPIWGLTYRILAGLLEILGHPGAGSSPARC